MNNKAVMIGLAVLAFLVAAVLVIMIFRMLFGGRLRMPGGRARQARLGIVDAFDLDRQRQLIIVRRDNVEHLIMIGGPNDLVVESEIVRAEAREARDTRREPGFGDGRIPAPSPAFDATGLPSPEQSLPPRQVPEELPAAARVPTSAPEGSAPPEPARAPTFPLPPRRPAPPAAPAPERRVPSSPPPRLPDSISRGDNVPALSGQPPAPAPAPPQPVPPASAKPPSPPPPAPTNVQPPLTPPSPAAAAPSGPSAAPTPSRPPFLKPLPPRPPMRPLQRTTPQAPGVQAGQGAPAAAAPSDGPASPKPVASAVAPKPVVAPKPIPPRSPPPPAPQSPKQNEPADALESLEEEMAKLLGRGS